MLFDVRSACLILLSVKGSTQKESLGSPVLAELQKKYVKNLMNLALGIELTRRKNPFKFQYDLDGPLQDISFHKGMLLVTFLVMFCPTVICKS